MTQSSADERLFQIDLDRSRVPRPFRDSQNLWREDLGRIYRLLDRQVAALKEAEEDEEHRGRYDQVDIADSSDDRPHLSIAVFGPSGSGKSSLIRTLADDVGRRFKQILPEKLHQKVASLPVMNPSTWGEKDQFLYAFLASALETEKQAQDKRERGYPQGLSPVQLAFQEVNEYLRVVDEPESSEEHDPLGLSLQKLERHTSGLRLKQALSHLIEQLAKELRSHIVLLPVDDLDMAPRHLVKALQSYQSYLMHPRLVPVFAFTDRMPEELIEVHYKNQLKDSWGSRRLEGSNRLTISEQMAVQFLARCFPVRNRIRLGPAPARVQRATYSARVLESTEREPQTAQILELLTQSSFLLFGHPDAEDAHQLRAALRPSTLRRQLQVADAMSDSHVLALRTPQFGAMADLKGRDLYQLAGGDEEKLKHKLQNGSEAADSDAEWETWKRDPGSRRRLAREWPKPALKLQKDDYEWGYFILARALKELDIGATWATLFNRAAWALLNVHRDTLRELGLFLEDLYSWSPKELRSVILENILAQDQVTRRTVLDRWFNRTDYRRSQVLSLLAANTCRPWMLGEEPFGDEEVPIRKQIEIEKDLNKNEKYRYPLDRDWSGGRSSKMETGKAKDDIDKEERVRQIRDRLTISAPQGLLWFLNVTLGFYLPQIMSRNWDAALEGEVPIKARVSGNGWDLHHAATNAVRIADAKKEMFSFGNVFLDPTAFRRSLELWHDWKRDSKPREAGLTREQLKKSGLEARGELGALVAGAKHKNWDIEATLGRNHLLLRLWTCHGYGQGRFWAAFSLWRGLSFIGQAIEIGFKHSELLGERAAEEALKKAAKKESRKAAEEESREAKEERLKKEKVRELQTEKLKEDLFRLVRTHGLQGLSPGSLLNKNSNDDRLLQAFPRWEPRGDLQVPIKHLVEALVIWLEDCWQDRIYPLPAGDIWIGWKDCFIRRIHGEYILGGLWPRINSSFLEEYKQPSGWYQLGKDRRTRRAGEEGTIPAPVEENKGKNDEENKGKNDEENKGKNGEENKGKGERFRWSAAIAAGAWSDLLLEYWRGCPPILKLLLTCPVMFKSNDRFGRPMKELGLKDFEKDYLPLLKTKLSSDDIRLKQDQRLSWLHRLGLPLEVWKDIEESWHRQTEKRLEQLKLKKPAKSTPLIVHTLVPTELAIPRADNEDFDG